MSAGIQVIKNFVRKGFRMVGSGCYAAVFESSSDPNVVYKIGITCTDPYLLYAQSALHSPYFPRIYSTYIDTVHDYYIISMERLDKLPDHKLTLAKTMRDQFVEDCNDSNLRSIVDCVQALLEADETLKLDLHEGNIMLRGLVPVVTDPIAHEEITEESDLSIWMDTYGNSLHTSVSA